tara:strand:- start:434 stop:1021 length:588 start_codon:yes stop_codon:yes gene_type:complete
MAEKQSKNKTKVPPIIIQHAECGHVTLGDEKDTDVKRARDVGIYGGHSQKLRLFRDGGFELSSNEDANPSHKKKGSVIQSVCKGAPLDIISEGDLHITVAGEFTVSAEKIVMEALSTDEEGINLDANHDIRISAGNNFLVTGDNITIDAKERIVSHSEGWQILIGQCIRLHEPQTKMCPAFMREYIDNQIKTLKN